MNIKERAKDELERRVQRVENFIADRGVGSSSLAKARTVQRNTNLAILLGGVLVIAGLTVWALSGTEEE